MALSSSSSSKRRYHSASPFYLFCKHFVDESTQNGRLFRTDKQGFEGAALKWNAMDEKEKLAWRQQVRDEKKKCAQEGDVRKLKMRNGDGGDPNCDPTELAKLKDLTLKSQADVASMTSLWTWTYTKESAIVNERFLLISVKSDSSKPKSAFTSLAVVEFSLGVGVTDYYHIDIDANLNGHSANARYEVVRRILNWPSKIGRRLGDNLPSFFAVSGQLGDVFDALTYVDEKTSKTNTTWNIGTQVSLSRDLATVDDLMAALKIWFKKSAANLNEEEIIGQTNGVDCLTMAMRCAERILANFDGL